jgi:hypothetical protein
MVRTVAATAGALAVAVSTIGGTGTHRPTTCHEDEACWNCHTMGNKLCGSDYITRSEFDRVVTVLQSDLQRHERSLAALAQLRQARNGR